MKKTTSQKLKLGRIKIASLGQQAQLTVKGGMSAGGVCSHPYKCSPASLHPVGCSYYSCKP